MVFHLPSASQQDQDVERLIVLRPHNGIYWRTTLWVYVALCVVAMTVAIGFAVIGFWPILPFAGLELTALGVALYVSARRGHYREVVRVSGGRVFVEKGRQRPEQHWEFHRAWCEVVLNPPCSRLRSARLALKSAGVSVVLGEFLTDDERTRIAQELRETIGPMGKGA